jgi:type I restriction enzyme M protein
MSLFIRMLELGGRCASIVPDGVLFGTSTAHLALRKELVDHQHLQAIISMPSGVFKPYAGVSTAIVVFTKTNAQSTDRVWFYDMKADGFSLDDKRNEIQDNDIPDIIERFHNLDGEAERSRKDQSFFVPAQEIRDNDYSLAINKYKEVEREKVVYDAPEVILGRFEQLQNEITEAMNEFKTKFMK